jgi:CDP-diacylglycerol---serine O-phosphatidyltransferase
MPQPRFSAADLLTAANGICGFLGLLVVARLWLVTTGTGLERRQLVACLLLYGIGMLCDVLDGPVARRLGSSGLGPWLDTVSDTITFGLLPAALLVARVHEHSDWTTAALVGACAYVGATILRLARQAAIDQRVAGLDPDGTTPPFTGMPSPVGGNCVLAIVVLAPPPLVSVAVTALVAWLLVASFPYPTNKTLVGGVFVGGLLVVSFAAIAGLIPLAVPCVIALLGLLPVALVRAGRGIVRGH